MKKDNPRRKRFNWKSRENVNTIIDDSEQKKIKVDIIKDGDSHYDACNVLVLPSAKRKTIKHRQRPAIKLLSRKHEKRLKKIVETKEKKLQVEQLIIDLQKVQANPEDLKGLTSLQETQTLGRRVFLNPSYTKINNTVGDEVCSELTISHLRWKEHPSVKKARNEQQSKNNKISERRMNYAVYTSSSSEDSDTDIEVSTSEHIMSSKEKEEDLMPVSNEEIKANFNMEKEKNDEDSLSVPCNHTNKKVMYKKKTKLKHGCDEGTEGENKVSKTVKAKKRKLEENCTSNVNSKYDNISLHKSKGKKTRNDQLDKSSGNCLKVKKKKVALNNEKEKNDEDSLSVPCNHTNKKVMYKKKTKLKHGCDEGTEGENKVSKTVKAKKRKLEETCTSNVNSKYDNISLHKSKGKKTRNDQLDKSSDNCLKVKKKKVALNNENGKLHLKKKKNRKLDINSNKVLTNPNESTLVKLEADDSVVELDSSKKCSIISKAFTKSRKFRIVNRTSEIQKDRLKLPILSEEHTVMEAINENTVTIIVGQTGSGKTTQVPQFLYEAGYTNDGIMIGVTEPRRVAAMTMSERVAFEMGLTSNEVSYQVRFDGNQCEQTEIKFMTDGILLKEIQDDCFLLRYSVIIIDEAHERNVQSDILIGLLSKLIRKRKSMGKPLKLVIMSATLRVQDFTENKRLFATPPPIIKIDSRIFDVNVYYNKITNPDYIEAAFNKIYNIHKQLPEGTILVFLTGQNEIHALCDKLKSVFPQPDRSNKRNKIGNEINKKQKKKRKDETINPTNNALPAINLDDLVTSHSVKENGDNLNEDEDNLIAVNLKTFNCREREQPLEVLPLYARLPAHEQRKVFEPPPPGSRLCVLTTNVAETSLTIPNVKYVVDSGKIKQKVYDHVNGVSSFKIMWTSKASADQRAGRAGRVCNGYCYRLFSSAVFNDEFEEHTIPEILRKPIDDVVLILKSFKFSVTTFPYPTSPDPMQLQHSIKRLVSLGALEQNLELFNKLKKLSNKPMNDFIDSSAITEQGLEMASLPIAPRFAKMILHSNQFDGLMPYVILIISALTFPDLLIDVRMDKRPTDTTDWEKRLMNIRLSWQGKGPAHDLGDLLVLINAVLEADGNKASFNWCEQHGLRYRDVIEIRKLRQQLTAFIIYNFPEVKLSSDLNLEPLSTQKVKVLIQVILTGSSEFVAKKVNYSLYHDPAERAKYKNSYLTSHAKDPVYISSLSVLHRDMPQYIMFQDIHRTSKTYLRGVTAISSMWLMTCAPSMCTFESPLTKPPPRYIETLDTVVCYRKGTYGPMKWELTETEVPYPESKELYKWVAYFLLKGELWPYLKKFTQNLYDPETLIQPICLRYKQLRENLIQALYSKGIKNRENLLGTWKEDPNFLKMEYFAWFCDENPLYELRKKWPPLPDLDLIPC